MVDAHMTGLVLAGGRSIRMGVDKARLVLGRQTLTARVVSVLEHVCDDVLVASGDGRRLDDLGVAQVADAVADAGPLGGLVAGLEAARHELVAVVAVDLPYASAAVLELLAERWSGQPAVVPLAGCRLQPLHAVYARAAAAPPLRRMLAEGRRSVTGAVRSLDPRVVAPHEWASADPAGRFALNLNRPEDLRALDGRP